MDRSQNNNDEQKKPLRKKGTLFDSICKTHLNRQNWTIVKKISEEWSFCRTSGEMTVMEHDSEASVLYLGHSYIGVFAFVKTRWINT